MKLCFPGLLSLKNRRHYTFFQYGLWFGNDSVCQPWKLTANLFSDYKILKTWIWPRFTNKIRSLNLREAKTSNSVINTTILLLLWHICGFNTNTWSCTQKQYAQWIPLDKSRLFRAVAAINDYTSLGSSSRLGASHFLYWFEDQMVMACVQIICKYSS